MLYKSNVITLELYYIVDMYLMSIDAWTQMAIILLILIVYGPGVVVADCWDRFCTLGRAPLTKETLPNFHEWCRVTRHPQLFLRLTGCQRTPRFWGVTLGAAQSITPTTHNLHVIQTPSNNIQQ